MAAVTGPEKEMFLTALRKLQEKEKRPRLLSPNEYQSFCSRILGLQQNVISKTSSKDYRDAETFAVVDINGTKSLFRRKPSQKGCTVDVNELDKVFDEHQMFEELTSVHLETGHGGRDRMMARLKQKKIADATTSLGIFLKICRQCSLKKPQARQGVVVKPIVSSSYGERFQVDLVDMQSQPDDGFKFIMHVIDHHTRYSILRPLKDKTAASVAKHLLQIFADFGAPKILQSDNGREFVNQIIGQFKVLWPDLQLVNGKPRHPQTQGCVERGNSDIKNMLRAWMNDNNSANWSRGLMFVQMSKNRARNRSIDVVVVLFSSFPAMAH